ncbi:hypothetical protein Lepto7376_2247 [[Leptolyngbya] sp. PCC 7376]|uniref:hypothetical protein n=1 Tax=[Leptolyngbya] sp. PCC 7376 TaxID=111781 RepID=UPI00029EC97D|nr:hypothetical protein [[Leptolyngbya] sp. PCC 7376]AFY38537.1 hypothetical protein Lepto7376_2247 [[Leptolyngbya] sp. PCC 7376]
MLEFSEIEAGYIIPQKALEDSVGYCYEENPEFFEYYRADVYRLVQNALEKITPHLNLKVYPALDFKGFVVLDPETLAADEIQLYHEQRNDLLRIQARQDIKRSEL